MTCIGAAAIGALLWAGLTQWFDGEFGAYAILIGVLVGGSCVLVGGRGSRTAVMASVFAFVSIVSGKLITAERAIAAEFHVAAKEQESVDYDAWVAEQKSNRTVRRRMLYSLHGLDLLSGAIGVSIAFMLVMRASRLDVARMRSGG